MFFLNLFLCTFLSGVISSFGADSFQAPKLAGPVVDEVGILSQEQFSALDRDLRALSDSGKAQVAVLITKSLQDLSIEEFGIRLAEAWKIGSKDKATQDRGVIFIVAPNERRMRIEVGYGLEGEIPDATASQILERMVKPSFRENRMSEGIFAGTQILIRLARGEAADIPISRRGSRRNLKGEGIGSHAVLLVFVVVLFFMGIFRQIPFAFIGGLGVGTLFFSSIWIGVVIAVLLNLLSRLLMSSSFLRSVSSQNGVFSGGGGFGRGGFGGGGGGFSGGGGSFGGGGSSSSW